MKRKLIITVLGLIVLTIVGKIIYNYIVDRKITSSINEGFINYSSEVQTANEHIDIVCNCINVFDENSQIFNQIDNIVARAEKLQSSFVIKDAKLIQSEISELKEPLSKLEKDLQLVITKLHQIKLPNQKGLVKINEELKLMLNNLKSILNELNKISLAADHNQVMSIFKSISKLTYKYFQITNNSIDEKKLREIDHEVSSVILPITLKRRELLSVFNMNQLLNTEDEFESALFENTNIVKSSCQHNLWMAVHDYVKMIITFSDDRTNKKTALFGDCNSDIGGKIAEIPINTEVFVTDICENGNYKIKWNKLDAFVKSENILLNSKNLTLIDGAFVGFLSKEFIERENKNH